MSVIIVEHGNQGLGIYHPEVEAVAGGSVYIINRTNHDIKMYDPNTILEPTPGSNKSISGKVIKANDKAKYYVRAGEKEGIYGYSIFAQYDQFYEILHGINGTPRIIIVA